MKRETIFSKIDYEFKIFFFFLKLEVVFFFKKNILNIIILK
jgi:hypothetical protein